MSDTKKAITILVIEDERPLQKVIKLQFEERGFEVVTARTVAQAFDLLQEVPGIKAIWLDHYLLGKEDGLDLVARLKESAEWKNIPVFVVSNTASEDKVKTYLSFGVEKYYTKSDYKLEHIVDDMREVLEKEEVL